MMNAKPHQAELLAERGLDRQKLVRTRIMVDIAALDLGPGGDIAGTVRAIFEGQIIPLRTRVPDIPERLAEVIERALAKDPAERWQTAAAMRTALAHSM